VEIDTWTTMSNELGAQSVAPASAHWQLGRNFKLKILSSYYITSGPETNKLKNKI